MNNYLVKYALVLLLVIITAGAAVIVYQSPPSLLKVGGDSIVMMQLKDMPILVDKNDHELVSELDKLPNSGIISLMQDIIQPGNNILEVGSGIGQYSLLMGKMIGEKGKLVVFEPNNKANSLLTANLKINDLWGRSIVVNKVPYASNAKITLESYDSGLQRYKVLLSPPSEGQVTTVSVAIDGLLSNQSFNLVKLNCYGSELQVLLGAQKTLQNSPNVYILMGWYPELMKYYGDIQAFINNMNYLGFEFWNVSNGAKELITKTQLLSKSFKYIIITKNVF